MSVLHGKHVVILGYGVAGKAAHLACDEDGARVTIVDGSGVNGYPTSLTSIDLADVDLAMSSPGYPPHSEDVLALQQAGIEIWSEMEFAWRVRKNLDAKWVFITGTNGKTTTTQMVGAIAEAAGFNTAVCGNMGVPVITRAREDYEFYAVEIASLQLHFTFTASPVASVCLNVDVDHLEWHGDRDAYKADKARVYQNTQVAVLYSRADAEVLAMVEEADVIEGCRAVGYGIGSPGLSQLGVVDGLLVDRAFLDNRHREGIELGAAADLQHLVAGEVPPYLLTNALAAAGLARAAGVPAQAVHDGLAGFALDKHRSALVATIDGVTYVDDSKATNSHAALAAFGAFHEPTVVWLVGGVAKGQEFYELVESVQTRLRAAVIIGEDQKGILDAFAKRAPHIPVTAIEPGDTVMTRAVAAARAYAQSGDTVLLSPANASWDQFTSYADRGDQFVKAVLDGS